MNSPAPGQLLNIGSRRLHVNVSGEGSPAVLFEAGLAATSLSWCLVQPLVAEFTTAISYDRAGLGWSDPAPHPATAAHAAEDVARLLDALAPAGPVVFVGHSFGGLIARVFEQRYPERVCGIVLVDPVVRAEWREFGGAEGEQRKRSLAHGVRLSLRGALLARLGVVGLALGLLRRGSRGSHYLPRMVARASAGRGLGVAERLVGEVRKMPRELWPAIAGHWSRSGSFRAMASALENLPVSADQLDEARSLGSLPIAVLSAQNATPRALAAHEADAALSSRGWHEVVPGTGHWIPLDAPEAVAAAIRGVAGLSIEREFPALPAL